MQSLPALNVACSKLSLILNDIYCFLPFVYILFIFYILVFLASYICYLMLVNIAVYFLLIFYFCIFSWLDLNLVFFMGEFRGGAKGGAPPFFFAWKIIL